MAVRIGSITLRDFEVPSAVRYGGNHRTVVHHLGDGRRIVDRLGADDTDISFSGTMSGSDASARARQLDRLRTTGEKVSLQWDSFQFDVIVRQFTADFQSGQWIPYQVSCAVLDQSSEGFTSDLSVGARTFQQDLSALTDASGVWAARLRSLTDRLNGQGSMSDAAAVLLVRQADDDVLIAENSLHGVSVNPLGSSIASLVRLMAQAVINRGYARRIAVTSVSEQ